MECHDDRTPDDPRPVLELPPSSVGPVDGSLAVSWLGRRGRNGIWVYWTSLDTKEQAIYVKLLRADMNKRWRDAKELAGLKRILETNKGTDAEPS